MDYITSLNDIHFPIQAQQLDIKRKFEEAGFPNTIGAVDGCHVSIKAPADDQMSYNNRKSFISIILQAVCTGEMIFSEIWWLAGKSAWRTSVPEFTFKHK